MNNNPKEKVDRVAIEKETIIKQVGDEEIRKVTVRVFVISEGKTRSIVFTPAKFEKFRKEINKVKF